MARTIQLILFWATNGDGASRAAAMARRYLEGASDIFGRCGFGLDYIPFEGPTNLFWLINKGLESTLNFPPQPPGLRVSWSLPVISFTDMLTIRRYGHDQFPNDDGRLPVIFAYLSDTLYRDDNLESATLFKELYGVTISKDLIDESVWPPFVVINTAREHKHPNSLAHEIVHAAGRRHIEDHGEAPDKNRLMSREPGAGKTLSKTEQRELAKAYFVRKS